MEWTVTVKPTGQVVSWEKLKAQCSQSDTTHRDLILDYEAECVAHAENLMECSLLARTITAIFYEGDDLHLPRGPVIEVLSVIDADDNALDHELYRVGYSDRLTLDTSPTSYPVTVVYRAGHEDAADIDADIRGAIRTHVATRFAIRETVHAGSLTTVTHLDEFYRRRSRGSQVA